MDPSRGARWGVLEVEPALAAEGGSGGCGSGGDKSQPVSKRRGARARVGGAQALGGQCPSDEARARHGPVTGPGAGADEA